MSIDQYAMSEYEMLFKDVVLNVESQTYVLKNEYSTV